MSTGYWGSGTVSGERRFDVLQSFKAGNQIVGHSTFINEIRHKRPYENRRRVNIHEDSSSSVPPKESVLMKIASRKSEAVLVATDKGFVQNPFDEDVKPTLIPEKRFKAICCVNKFPLFARYDKKHPGVMLIAFSTGSISYPQEAPKLVGNLLLSLKYAIKHLYTPERYMTTFFNIGSSSGASLSQLHGQTYIYDKNLGKGYLQYIFKEAQKQWWGEKICVICDLLSRKQAHNEELASFYQAETDHL